MRFAFTDDQLAFAAGLTDVLAGECPPAVVRAAWDDRTGHAPSLWGRLGELGLFSLLVPVERGGMGGGMVDAVLLFERLGAAATPGPILEQIVGAGLLADESLANGSAVVTITEDLAQPVAHAAVADVILTAGATVREFATTPVPGLDGGRTLAVVSGGTVSDNDVDADTLRDHMSLAISAQLIGVASTMIDQAAEYARARHQFGKPIGTFQAVKHHLADALLAVEFARAPTWRAAWSLDQGLPTAPADVSMARVLAATGAQRAARRALQVHGAIGYTWECDLQLWMKKVWAIQAAFGDTSWHRRRVSSWLLDGDGPVTPDGVTMPSFELLR